MYKGLRLEVDEKVVKDILHYDPESGIFTWREDRPLEYFQSEHQQKIWKSKHGGNVAGYVSKDKRNFYTNIKIFSKRYYAHQLAWLYMTGEWPSRSIDHIDGDGTNNKWVNLREVDNRTNCWNQKLRTTNKSGVTGVYFDNNNQVWMAKAGEHKLGQFYDMESAILCRREWEESFNLISDRHGKE